MMKNLKRIFLSVTLFSVVILLFAFNGCSGNANGNDKDSSNNQEITKEQTSEFTANGEVQVLTTQEFKEKVFNYDVNTEWKYLGEKPCVIDFYADWCKPCRLVAPIMEELAAEYEGKITFYKVNVDNEQELAQVFGIYSIPSILYCPMEAQPQISAGALEKEDYKKLIIDILKVE